MDTASGTTNSWRRAITSALMTTLAGCSTYVGPVSEVHGDDSLRVTYVNHATVFIQATELNIPTDTIWSDRAGPLSLFGARRIRAPGVRFDELPRIDVVLISHDHYDHRDLPTLQRLVSRDYPVILTGLGVKARLASIDSGAVHGLDWWQQYPLQRGSARITFVPARHGSGRPLLDTNTTLWGGFSIQVPAGNVLFMGDTAFGECISEVYSTPPRHCSTLARRSIQAVVSPHVNDRNNLKPSFIMAKSFAMRG